MSVREARAGDRWLLCSDGLSGVVSGDTLAETLRDVADVDACADQLVQLALRGGAPDNVTVVIGDGVDLDPLPDGGAPSTSSPVVGAAALDRHTPTRGGKGAAARAAEHSAAARAQARQTDDAGGPGSAPEGPADEEEPERGPWLRRILWLVTVLVVLGGAITAGYLGYGWTQEQYYVGVQGEKVAIFRGIPQSVGPLELSTAVETSDTVLADLPGFVRDRLAQTIRADSLDDARRRVADLESEADGSS
jgi:protein phosphatase